MSTRKKVKIDEDLVAFMDVEKALKDHYDERKLKILVCGKTGTGKSTLLNTLLGQNLFAIGGLGDSPTFGFTPVTPKVTSVCTSIQNVFLEIFDSPGLQDGTDNDQEYLDDMHSKCRDVDLVLYCTDMTTVR